MRRLGRVSNLVLWLGLLGVLPRALAAQATTITGTVMSTSGRGGEGAAVELRDLGTSASRTATSGETGQFRFDDVFPGEYQLRATLVGFRPGTARITVDSAGTYTVDLRLATAMLQEVVVTATRTEQEVGRIAAAVNVLTEEEIQRARTGAHLEESLRRVPGLRVEDELGGTSRTRIIIRGTGTRANSPAGSGVRGVRVMVDGIPKNNAGGSAQDLVNIDLESAERIEVLKGPSSALYGNQSGGVVNIITQDGPREGLLGYRQTVGSFNTFREHLKFGGQRGDLNYFASVYRSDQDGYRQNSYTNSTGFHSKLRLTIDERSQLMLLADFDRNFQQSPGPLTEEQFRSDPRQADSVFLANRVRSTVEEFRLGAVYRREIFGQDALELTGYYIPRHLGPFQQIGVRIPQDFTNRGGGFRYLYTGSLGRFANRFTVGAEFQNTPITTGIFSSTNGQALAELEENSTVFGVYVLDEFSLFPDLVLSLGGRFDNIHFTSENLTRASPVASRLFQKFTPKAGVSYQPVPTVSVYGTYGQGFEAPVIGELRVLPGGEFGFNAALDPQTAHNYEIGARAVPFEPLALQLAVFHQEVRDYISPFGTFPNNSFQNAGEVDQFGIEVGAELRFFDRLTAGLAYTFSDFTFDEFNNGVDDFSGNRLPGIPRHTIYGELRYSDPRGMFGAVEVQSATRFFTNDANTASNPPYTVANARFGYEYVTPGGVRVSPFLGVNNLWDESYSAFALINDRLSRFFNPLPKLSAYGGLGVTF